MIDDGHGALRGSTIFLSDPKGRHFVTRDPVIKDLLKFGATIGCPERILYGDRVDELVDVLPGERGGVGANDLVVQN